MHLDDPTTYRSRLEQAFQDCANEPIHRPGAIQPLGVLIALDSDLIITHASENLEQLFPYSAGQVIGLPFSTLVGERQARAIIDIRGLGIWRRTAVTEFRFADGGHLRAHDAHIHRSSTQWIVEIEIQEQPREHLFHELFIPVRDALWQLDAETNLRRYTEQVVEQVRLLTGYDRVMMYKFDTNWDGEVIAESRATEAESYLGNRFPASDIPAQARKLYTRNLIRLIGDVEAPPVAVICRSDRSRDSSELDMSQSSLRAFSPVHLEYLRNMGVRATLTISLLQNDRLWGLIACHHYSPKYIPIRVLELDEFIGKTVSLKLSNLENQQNTQFYEHLRTLLGELTNRIRANPDIPEVLNRYRQDLLKLVRAGGAVIVVDGQRFPFGATPGERSICELERWLAKQPPTPVFHTESLSKLFPPANAWHEVASGLLVAPLDARQRDYIAWFRPALRRTVRWAGNPEKGICEEAGRLRLSPRKSFETWSETFRDSALPWAQHELEAADALSVAIIDVLAHQAQERSEANYRLLAEHSTDLIARLDTEGRFTFVSDASDTILGYPPGSLTGTLATALAFHEDRQTLRETIDGLHGAQQIADVLVRMIRADGNVVWMEFTLKRMDQSHSRSFDIVMNARDVTQRQTYQLAIEDLHQRNTQILEAAMDGVISIDEHGAIVYVNERAGHLLGYDPSALRLQSCCNLLASPTAAPRESCELLQALRDHQTVQGKRSVFRRHDGTEIAVEYYCTPIANSGAAAESILVFKETHQQYQLDDRIAAHDTVIRHASEAVMVTDSDGRIISVNPAFTQITGYSPEEASGNTPRLLKSGVHTPRFYAALWTELKRNGYWNGEIWNRRKNGEIYPQWGNISIISDQAGRVINYVAVFSDISKAKNAEDKLYFLANHDSLTGLPNRSFFVRQLTQGLVRSRSEEFHVGVIFIDLDRFKLINDTLGHSTGDRYLVAVAERIQSAIREHDVLSRWGGDEFVAFLDVLDSPATATEIAARILDCVNRPLFIDNHEITPTISMGISLYPNDALDAENLIAAADAAMYRAKESGRNGYQFYTTRLAEETKRKFSIVSELRRAIRDNELLLHYQPQVDPKTSATVGLEALIRWRHPSRGLLGPQEFIPHAEELGLIGEVGDWVLNEVCRQMASWLLADVRFPRVAINVSPQQLKMSFVDSIQEALAIHGLPAQRIELEITEGALERSGEVLPIFQALTGMGVSLSIDDFGTGYSSLAHIKRFPVDRFKIDKSFIDGIPADRLDTAIVSTILAFGSNLGVDVVAEGVETIEQLDFLASKGRCSIQGFHYSRPLNSLQVSQWLCHHPTASVL